MTISPAFARTICSLVLLAGFLCAVDLLLKAALGVLR
jgi:hypothetical protein